MTNNDINSVLEKVIGDVFDGMYFMFPEKCDGADMPPVPRSGYAARVDIKNSPMQLMMYGSEKLVADMAAAFLGTEKAFSEEDLMDVFKEAMNLIGGNLVNTLAFDKEVCLAIPEVEKRTSGPGGDYTFEIVFDVDGELLKAAVRAG